MNYYIYGYTDKGKYRSHNEDSLLVNRVCVTKGGYSSVCIAPFLAAVCDGVGGEQAGELASEICVSTLACTDYDSSVNLDHTLMQIHNKIVRTGVSRQETINMQTTICLLAVDENGTAVCYNAGDSRMYRYTDGEVRQLSVDQTYGRFLYEKGEIETARELSPELKNAIVSSLGSVLQRPNIEHVEFPVPFGRDEDDVVIICSDGVSDFVSQDEIEIALQLEGKSFGEKLEALCELAIRNGSTDNISIIGIKPWETVEQYRALTKSDAPPMTQEEELAAKEAEALRKQAESLSLEEQSDLSLAALFADLEKFKQEP
ncbi:MAG: serine/threonine-protein phosphatase [Ruminococcus sp.]|nr:serine/threonine-protein phosphatase [Ruminococcus sp.]